MSGAAAAACCIAAALAAAPSWAFVSPLPAGLEREASDRGRAAARAHDGLPASSYVAYQTPDALHTSPSQGAVDAIVVGTPYERVLYLSYETAFVGSTPSPAAMADARDAGSIDVIVFAHARDPKDQSFLRRFTDATLRIGGAEIRPSRVSTSEATQDFFTTPSGRQFLWLGTATFRFPVSGAQTRSKARFSVMDPYGRTYRLALDLGAYR